MLRQPKLPAARLQPPHKELLGLEPPAHLSPRQTKEADITRSTPNIDRISAGDLRDTEALKALYLEAVRRQFWPVGEQAALEFFALAEKALQDDSQGTPGRLFYGLVKRNHTATITNEAEFRAQQRLNAGDRRALFEQAMAIRKRQREEEAAKTRRLYRSEELDDFFGRDIAYHHSILMQCFLPQAPLPPGERTWATRHGSARLEIEAGRISDSKKDTSRLCAVPAGSKARLILPYIVRQAVIERTHVIDLGRSLRNFMSDRLKIPVAGQNAKPLVREIENIAAATFMIGSWNEHGHGTRWSRVASATQIWVERNPNQTLIWNPRMELSRDFYDSITERSVPVDMTHLRQLAKSPRRMDLYLWLSHRTPTIKRGRPVPIKLADLQHIFARNMQSPRLFKQRLKQDLAAIHRVYSRFRVEIDGDALVLWRSPPPVPRRKGHVL